MSDENKLLSTENETLKKDNASMAEYILDIECRSMQDNLEFMEMPEHTDPHVVPTYANQMEINQSQQEENPDSHNPRNSLLHRQRLPVYWLPAKVLEFL